MPASEGAANFSCFSFVPERWFSRPFHQCATDNNDGCSGLNFFWIFPVNAVFNAVAIVLTPLFATIHLIAALIFKMVACCVSEEDDSKAAWDEAARRNFVAIRNACTCGGIGVMLLRIFNPNYRGCHQDGPWGTDRRILPGSGPGGTSMALVPFGQTTAFASSLDGID
jgi:hypothetical protein